MEDVSGWWMLLKTLGSLGLVLLSIFVVAWVYRKFARLDKWVSNQNTIRVVQTLDLGGKKKLMIVDIQHKRMLLGVAEQSITALAEMGEAKLDSIQGEKEHYAQTH